MPTADDNHAKYENMHKTWARILNLNAYGGPPTIH